MDIVGTWENQLGSILDVQAADAVTGALSGTYSTAVGKPSPTRKYALAGYVQGTLIGFTVSYGDIDCICCWVSRLEQDGRLHTMWQYVTAMHAEADPVTGQMIDTPIDLWKAFHVQGDVFVRRP